MAGQSLNPATHHRLGGLLPRQLANGPRPRPTAPEISPVGRMAVYPEFPQAIRLRWVGSHVLRTRLPLVYPEGPYRSTCMLKTRR